MDVLKVMKEGLDLLIKDILVLVVAGLAWAVLTVITLGVLGGPLTAGLFRMILLRMREDRTPEFADIFYFERFGRYVVAFYVLTILVGLASLLLVVPGLYLATIWIYVFALMVDRDLSLSQAMSESKALVERGGLGQHFGLVVLLSLVGAVLSSLTKGLGSLVGTPFSVICVLLAYRIMAGESASSLSQGSSADGDA